MSSSFSFVANLAQVQDLGKRIGQLCQGGEVIFLTGELGAGKTTLTQAIGETLGVKSVITSPTFIMVNEYSTARDQTMIHADLYRTASLDDVVSLGLFEMMGQTENITLIEWPEKCPELEKLSHLHFELSGEGKERLVVVSLHGNGQIAKLFQGLVDAYALH